MRSKTTLAIPSEYKLKWSEDWDSKVDWKKSDLKLPNELVALYALEWIRVGDTHPKKVSLREVQSDIECLKYHVSSKKYVKMITFIDNLPKNDEWTWTFSSKVSVLNIFWTIWHVKSLLFINYTCVFNYKKNNISYILSKAIIITIIYRYHREIYKTTEPILD